MLERIRQILSARSLSPTQFADTIGVGRPVVSHILSGRNKPSLEVLQKIIDAFPELSLPWLLKGEGPMLVAMPAAAAPPAATAPAATAAVEAVSGPVASVARKKQRPTPPKPEPTAEAGKQDATPAGPEAAVSIPASTAVAAPAEAPAAQAAGPATTSSTLPDVLAAAPAGKAIRRIIIFYRDGTFTDYQPEEASA